MLRGERIQLVDVGIFQGVLELRAADPVLHGNILHRLHEQGDSRHPGKFRLQAPNDIARTDLAFIDRLQIDEHAPAIQRGVRPIDADKGGKVIDGRIFQDDTRQRLLFSGHLRERNGLRCFGNTLNDPGILNREKPFGDVGVKQGGGSKGGDGHEQSRGLMAKHHLEGPVIEVRATRSTQLPSRGITFLARLRYGASTAWSTSWASGSAKRPGDQ